MICPCEKCIVRPTCKSKMCVDDHLIMASLLKCPLAKKFLRNKNDTWRKNFYEKVYQITKIFNVGKNFSWRLSDLEGYMQQMRDEGKFQTGVSIIKL